MKAKFKIHSYNKNEALSPASIPELSDWLTSTAALQVPDLEAKVKQFLYVECSEHERLELLDWIRPLLSNTARAVRAANTDGKLPLPDHILGHVDGLARIYAIMADLYKTCLTGLAATVLAACSDSDDAVFTPPPTPTPPAMASFEVGDLVADAGVVERTESFGYCPQVPVLYERLTCDEHLELFGAAYGLGTGDLARSREQLYEELDFARFADSA